MESGDGRFSRPRHRTAGITEVKFTNGHDLHAGEIIYEMPDNMPGQYLKDGKPLFVSYKCVLLERQTQSGAYVYTAVNLSDGRSVLLSRRQKQLTESSHRDMAAKIYVSPIRGDGIHTTDKKPDETMMGYELIDTAKYIFNEVLPHYGYAVREKQVELAEHILDIVGRRGITLAESEVGTGKTPTRISSPRFSPSVGGSTTDGCADIQI